MNGEQDTGTEQSQPARLRLLLVDDELDLLGTLSEILEGQGYTVVSTWAGEDAVDIAELFDPNVLVTDFRLPGIDGVTVVRRIREQSPGTRAILVSGHISRNTRQRAEQEHVDCILEKPVSVPELLRELKVVA